MYSIRAMCMQKNGQTCTEHAGGPHVISKSYTAWWTHRAKRSCTFISMGMLWVIGHSEQHKSQSSMVHWLRLYQQVFSLWLKSKYTWTSVWTKNPKNKQFYSSEWQYQISDSEMFDLIFFSSPCEYTHRQLVKSLKAFHFVSLNIET